MVALFARYTAPIAHLMSILIVAAVSALAMALLWAVQSWALLYVGEPLAWPLRYTTRRPLVRWTGRAMIQISWLLILFAVPFALGMSPGEALHRALPLPVPWHNIAIGSLVVALPFLPVLTIYWLVGWLRIEPQFDVRTRRSKLVRRFLTPIPLATMEEAVFRGVVLEQLLQTMPQILPYRVLAVVISAILFSSVHFIRPQHPAKPVWQQAYGFFLAGCLFGIGYIAGGRNLWVPIALHASAILCIEIGRLYCRFMGPRWIVGFADSPYSGVIGTVAVACMALILVMLI
jgi:membrane protease YdiL (CAAX protease family)